jgi:hypothetical protein
VQKLKLAEFFSSPEPVLPPTEGTGGNDISGKYYYYWLNRMLRVFNTKKPNVPPVTSEKGFQMMNQKRLLNQRKNHLNRLENG